jgi:hypothetical protein
MQEVDMSPEDFNKIRVFSRLQHDEGVVYDVMQVSRDADKKVTSVQLADYTTLELRNGQVMEWDCLRLKWLPAQWSIVQ